MILCPTFQPRWLSKSRASTIPSRRPCMALHVTRLDFETREHGEEEARLGRDGDDRVPEARILIAAHEVGPRRHLLHPGSAWIFAMPEMGMGAPPRTRVRVRRSLDARSRWLARTLH